MSTNKAKKKVPAEALALYDKLVATNPDIQRKGASVPYTSHNGHMFTFLSDGVLAIRLPEKERNNFLKKYETTLVEAYGTVMKEYVAVPEYLLKNTEELQPYLEMSFHYIQSLKPKPTTKKKK